MFETPTIEELNLLGALPLILLSLGTCLLLVIDRFVKRKFYTAVLSLVGVGVSLVVALLQAGGSDSGDPGLAFEGTFIVDQFTHVVNIVALVSAGVGILLSYDYLERTKLDRGEYYILLLFAAI